MNVFIKRGLLFAVMLIIAGTINAQKKFNAGSVSGNFKLDAQTYQADSLIGANEVPEKILSNSYMNVIYNNGKFTAGVRFEGYLNTMLGYDKPYDGFGLASRYATYSGDVLEVTAGNYYEQFGNGLVFRTYEDRDLGYDNAMDGMRVKLKPADGVVLTGIIGNQRIYWEKGEGIVRGVDGDFALNNLFEGFASSNHRITIGGSFVSKFQKDESPLLILPENVATGGARINYSIGKVSLAGEYAYKSQDPSSDNNFIYKPGSALLLNGNYSQKGLGVMLQYKWVDNMSSRSERDAQINNLLMNSLPAISKNHTYAFAAMYPYATQIMGEAGMQAELFYKLKKGTFLGGKYGTMLALNFARVVDIKRDSIDATTGIGKPATDGYKTSLFSMTDSLFHQDINIEITKKFNKKLKGIFTYQYLTYNQLALEGHGFEYDGIVNAHTVIADVTWKIKSKHSLRIEGQALFTGNFNHMTATGEKIDIKQDYGNWAMLILEYSVSPHWFFALSDQFNYVSADDELAKNTALINHASDLHRSHFFSVAMGYSKGASRIQMSYGKQREGILCVGGVCRAVPAAYGFNISISTTF